MKIIKFIAILAVSVVLLSAAFITIFGSMGDKTASVSDTQAVENISQDISSDSTNGDSNTDSAVLSDESESTADTDSEAVQETVKTVLGDVTIGDIGSLSSSSVVWGPGVSFNDNNQPTACVTLQEKYGDLGAVFVNDDDKIYLTFDLGYESGFTNDILDVLKANNVKATFFVTGSYAEKQGEIVQRIIDEGHTVGNHSWSHPDMTTLNDTDAALEITKVHDIVKEKYGYETYLFRFPAGTFSEKTLAIAAQNGHHSVFWSFAYNDWDNANQPDVTEALKKTTDRLHPGAVYLLHPMETNSKILGDLIANAKAAGYEIGVF
ncbi:MAG: polysaccharide deacetylase family protein [Oscillospiraceae bacterium]|nr:polysaccharide deacetylase family protein [Oscillospiraceae bacterium]